VLLAKAIVEGLEFPLLAEPGERRTPAVDFGEGSVHLSRAARIQLPVPAVREHELGLKPFGTSWPITTPACRSVWGSKRRKHSNRQLIELDRALARLPSEQREVVLLVGLEGMDYESVAHILGVPIGTVRSRLSRGRERLRELMGRDREPQQPSDPANTDAAPMPPRTASQSEAA
jgi:RNA polymerase sigma factor (sigma-70 family)